MANGQNEEDEEEVISQEGTEGTERSPKDEQVAAAWNEAMNYTLE